jgi:hypothetical protein
MKILKKILIVVAILIAIPLIVALFVSKEYNVEREVVINKPKQDVFNYIKFLKNQSNYSKWVMMDPNAKMTYSGVDGTVGFKSAWDSENKKVGQGEQTISKIDDGNRIDLGLHFIKPFEGDANAYMTTEDAAGQTKVKWGFNGKMPYPMNIMNLFMGKEIGNDLSTGLTNLKGVLEK